jgi:SAM-dependent methyltransferase
MTSFDGHRHAVPADLLTHTNQEVHLPCRICASVGKRRFFKAKERQFGMGDEFTYFECGACGSLCINSIPTDLSKYYPPHYYSFGPSGGQKPGDVGWLRRKLRAHRSMFNIDGSDWLGALVQRFGTDYFNYPWSWFHAAGVTPSSAILDNGCGAGALLRALRDQGFTNLSGVDPFVSKSINEPYLQITKGEIFDLKGPYDLVMFHHSLEHVADPARYLTAAAEVCAPGGVVLVRIPVADGYGWREFGECWFALDAPRHLAIPSKASMKALGVRCGLVHESTVCDSESVCFWGSELYKNNIPAVRSDGKDTITADKPFSEEKLEEYRRRAREINEANDGDLALFIFRKPKTSA